MIIYKDEIFYFKKKALRSTIAFLQAIKCKLPRELAIEVATEAAAIFMITTYQEVFKGTEPNTQERFNAFRAFYEAYPQESPYCEILESKTTSITVKFRRCPHAEILSSENLFEFAESSCLSDNAFTCKLMPGIKFTREKSLVKGDSYCIIKWEMKE